MRRQCWLWGALGWCPGENLHPSPPLPAHGASAPCSGDGFLLRDLPLCRAHRVLPLLLGAPGCGPHSMEGAGQRLWLRLASLPALPSRPRVPERRLCSTAARSKTTLRNLRMASKGQGRGKGVVCLGLKASDLTCPMIADNSEAQGPQQVT